MGQPVQSIRRVVVTSPTDITLEHVARPHPAPGEVLIRTAVVGICGSDMHALHGRHPFVSLPMRPGHEVVGVVADVGPGVPTSLRGARVVIEPNLACGTCAQCASGRYNICDNLAVFGCQTPGGMADFFTIAADRVVTLPDDVDDTWAALIEPAATPVHAVRRAGDLTGRAVIVLGAGPIGLLAVLAARAAGADRVVAADLLASKRALAIKMGAHGAFDPDGVDAACHAETVLGGKADVVFDCVSRETTVRLGIQILKKGGLLMTVGVPIGPTLIDLDLIQDREITMMGNLMYTRNDIYQSIALLREKSFTLTEFVTAEYDIAAAADAFHASDDPEHVKVLVTVRDQPVSSDRANEEQR